VLFVLCDCCSVGYSFCVFLLFVCLLLLCRTSSVSVVVFALLLRGSNSSSSSSSSSSPFKLLICMQIRVWDDMLLLLLFVAHGLPLIAFCWYVFFFSLLCIFV
jgi:hypothetical protein